MALLSIKKRQEYLKYLGFYKGSIDGVEGPKTKDAYLKLQKKYYFNKKDKDGKYGPNTDILLYNAYWVKKLAPNFDLKKELRCGCKGKYCTGYPVKINLNALKYLQEIRTENGSTKCSSFLRCKTKNDKTKGSSKTSRHLSGKAFDFYNRKVCKSLSNRKSFISTYIKKTHANYSYCDGYGKNKTSTSYPNADNMGKYIHCDVK